MKFFILLLLAPFLFCLSNCSADQSNKSTSALTKEEAAEHAKAYMSENYAGDSNLKDISTPSKMVENGDSWIVSYDDKSFARLPSGVALSIDKKTGKISRINQE